MTQTGTLLRMLLALMLIVSMAGCNGSSGSSDASTNDSTTNDMGANDTTPASSYAVTIDFTANTAQVAGESAQSITTAGATLVSTTDGTSIVIQTTTYGITITSTVGAVVTYNLSGSLSGTLSVESANEYLLNLDAADITAVNGPALDLESEEKAYIVSAAGTTNTLTDSGSRSDGMTMKAALYGKGAMVFSGEGTITVHGSYKHGIFCNDYIHVQGGTLNVTTSAKDAVRSVNGFIFDDGALTINATGTTTDDESKGIKVEGDDDTTNGADKGYIEINGGSINVTSVGKAITAGWDIDEDLGDNASGNPDPYVEINGGAITITTTGTAYENTDGTSCAPEGIEGKSRVTITGGTIVINANEDAINAGDAITISGGYIYAKSNGTDVDAFDSNGDITVSGGVIVAIAPNGGTCNSFDKGDNSGDTFSITGGTVVGIGGVICQPTVTQNTVVYGSMTSGQTIALKSSSDTVLAFTIPQTYATMVISSPDILTNTAYSVYSGGSLTAYDTSFHGLYLGNLTYTGGSIVNNTTFTASGLTKKGGANYF